MVRRRRMVVDVPTLQLDGIRDFNLYRGSGCVSCVNSLLCPVISLAVALTFC